MSAPMQEQPGVIDATTLRSLVAEALGVPVDDVDVERSSAALGIDSLAAAELQERLAQYAGLHVALERILAVDRIVDVLGEASADDAPLPGGDAAPLGPMQEALCYAAGKDPASSAYQLNAAFRWRVDATDDAIRGAVRALLERHPELTAVFAFDATGRLGKTYSSPARPDAVVLHDARALDAAALTARLQIAVDTPIDLALGPPFRLEWYRVSAAESVCLFVVHHAVMDLWSFSIVLDDFVALLDGDELRARSAPYAEFAVRQQARAQAERDRQLAFWALRLRALPPRLSFEGDAAVARSTAGRHAFSLDATLTSALSARARALGVTLNSVLLALHALVVARYAAQDDVLVGLPVAGRRSAAFARTVGCCINTLGVRVRTDVATDLAGYVVDVHAQIRAAQAHDDLPFHQLVEQLADGTNDGRADLQTAFVLQRIPKLGGAEALVLGLDGEPCTVRGHAATAVSVAASDAPFDLGLMMIECAGRLHGRYEFRPAAIASPLVHGMATYFAFLAECFAADPQRTLAQFDGLTDAQRAPWLAYCAGPTATFAGPDGIYARFAAVAAQRGDHTAIVAERRRYSYTDVASRSAALGARLAAAGVRDEQRVVVMTERTADTVIAMLAIWRCGAAYVPVAEDAPHDRVEKILTDCRPVRILATARTVARVPDAWRAVVVRIDDAAAVATTGGAAVTADHLAYVVYTSGSEGLPKGVMATHGGAVNFALSQAMLLGLDANERLLQQASFGFDASLSDVLMALLTGATLVIANAQERLPGAEFSRLVDGEGVSLITVSASLLDAIDEPQFPALRSVISTAEACTESIVRRWGRQRALFNGYGPTEVTIGATIGRCVAAPDGPSRRPSIGRPFHHYAVYVLDDALRPVPYGVAGDLYIGGAGVARGYLHDPGKTAAAFVPDPFASEPGRRMYRTGDRGLLRSDGAFECLGRRDQQIKVRGHRVELAEVERAVRELPGVRLAAVVAAASATGASELHAFIEPADGEAAEVAAWRDALKRRLPDYMRPARVTVGVVPVTANGKIDRRALTERAQLRSDSLGSDRVGPKDAARADDVVRRLRAIWRHVLGHDGFADHDNFFDVGGHSLALVGVQSAIAAEFGTTLPLTDLFRFHTIGQLAPRLGGPREESAAPEPRLAPPPAGAPIAIVGMALRFPGADDRRTFWDDLVGGRCGARFFTAEELRRAGVPAALAASSDYVPARAAIDDAYAFDAGLFGCAEREAELLDPQRRLLLECSFEALQHAGYDDGPRRARAAIGAYLCTSENSYHQRYVRGDAELARVHGDLRLALAGDKSFVATYIAYKLRLKGPAITIDTACSSSLVAVHEACKSLRAGDCDVAIAGGMSIDCPQAGGHRYEPSGIGSRDGYCRAFDADATGTVKGMGGGVVVLKDLAAALADGDVVYAVIHGSAVNNDAGRSAGYTAPSIEGQRDVIRAALAAARCDASQIDLIEAHGTGTPLGDPIEFAALRDVFAAPRADAVLAGSILVGSVKSNIGHLDAAAGIAGLIKTCLALQHRICPPTLHVRAPNPELRLGDGPLALAAVATPLHVAGRALRAGVSSFGIGGTNCHVVLGPGVDAPRPAASDRVQLILLSAHTRDALRHSLRRLADGIAATADTTDLAALAYTLAVERAPRAFRVGIVAHDAHDLVAKLRDAADMEHPAPSVVPRFAFASDDASHAARELHAYEAVFRDAFEQLLADLDDAAAAACRAWLSGTSTEAPDAVQRRIAVSCCERAAAHYVQSFGLEPEALLDAAGNLPRDLADVLAAVATLWERGVDVDAAAYFTANQGLRRRVELPPYGFDRRRYSLERESPVATDAVQTQAAEPASTSVASWLRATWIELLGVPTVDADTDFYAAGGDSLSVLGLCRLVDEQLGARVGPDAIMAASRFDAMVECIERAVAARAPVREAPPASHEPAYVADANGLPLSFQQRRMWFEHYVEAQPAILNLPLRIDFGAAVDADRLAHAFGVLLRRHPALCTRLVRGDEPRQYFDRDPAAFPLTFERAAPHDVAHIVQEHADAPFDLERDWLLRAHLVATNRGDTLVVVCHHFVADGRSLALVVRDLLDVYRNPPVAEVRGSAAAFARYVARQAERVAGGGFDAQLAHWERTLAGATETPLPGALAAPAAGDRYGRSLPIAFADDFGERLHAFCAAHGVTPFVALLAVFACLIAVQASTDDICIGTPVAERDAAELDACVGLFVNTVVLRNRVRPERTFASVCRDVADTVNAALANRQVPFDAVVERVAARRTDRTRAPLFRAAFVMENDAEATGDAVAAVRPVDKRHAQFDLALWLGLSGTLPHARLEFRRACFDGGAMATFAREFGASASRAIAYPETRVCDLVAVSRSDASLLFGPPAEVAPLSASLPDLLLAAAARHADRPAVVAGDDTTTHHALAERALRVASALRDNGVAIGDHVGVHLPRSTELVVALYGALLAGAVFVPLDVDLPPARVRQMLADSAARAVLTRTDIADVTDAADAASLPRIDVDRLDARRAAAAPPVASDVDWPAYLLYTSGSTGVPKGVVNTQRGLLNRLLWMNRRYGFGRDERFLHKTPIGFDVALWEIFCPLLCGASVVVAPPGDHRDPQALRALIDRRRINVVHYVPTMLKEYLAATPPHAGPAYVFCSGEGLPAHALRTARAHWGARTRLINLYGPTEASIEVSDWEYRDACDGAVAPIGRPISGASLYVLDASLTPVPPGQVGDLYIAGTCVALGYWRRAALTAESFLPDPWASECGARMYRTGDRARELHGGDIEFLGRGDAQLKIDGFRIEPGEVEAALRAVAGVDDAIVMLHAAPNGDPRLVAYVVARAAAPSAETLRRALRERLPAYMVPSVFVPLARLPVGANGKLDRAALPPPMAPQGQGMAVPQSDLERRLVDVWRDVLDLAHADRDSDFFAAGGSSIRAIRLAGRIEAATGRRCEIRAIFAHPVLADLAAALERGGSVEVEATDARPEFVPAPGDADDAFDMTELQRAYWAGRARAFELGNVATHGYLELDVHNLDIDAFRTTVRHLVATHDALRLVVDDQGRQRVLPTVAPYDVADLDLRDLPTAGRDARLASIRAELEHAVHEPARWPLFDFRVARLDGATTRVFVSIDALIVDGLSIQLLENDLNAVYREVCGRATVDLPPRPALRLRDYVHALNAQRGSAAYARARDYWTARIATLPPAPPLPLARDPAAVDRPRFVRLSARLGARTSQRLARAAATHRASLSALLLAGYADVLASWSNTTALSLNLTISERVKLHRDADRLVGNLSSLLIVGLDVAPQHRFADRLAAVRDALLEAMEHRSYGGLDVLRGLAAQRGDRNAARMPVVFTSLVDLAPPSVAVERCFDFSRPAYAVTQTSQVWLDCNVAWSGDELVVAWDAVASLFAPGALEYFHAEYVALLTRLADDAGAWDATPLPLYADRDTLLWASAGAAAATLGRGELLHERFLDAAARDPDRIAIATTRRGVTYGALARGARRVAAALHAAGARPNRPVAVVMQNGWEQVLACLAILIAGVPYLPIGAAAPPARRARLLALGGCEIALTADDSVAIGDAGVRTVIRIDASVFDGDDIAPVANDAGSADLAYVMYTSGSTGEPKGVMIDHRGAVNTVLDINRRYDVQAGDAVLALSDFTFDLSVYDVFGVLGAGATIVLPEPEQSRDPGAWLALMHEHRVTLWNAVPALTQMLVDYLDATGTADATPLAVRLFLVSGDWIPVTLPGRVRRYCPDARFVSLGGATEASIWSIAHDVDVVDPDRPSIPYGTALTAQSVLVVDPSMRVCPPGVTGQIVIGGVGVARGYWNSPAQTAAAFVVEPRTAQRLYRTGDLGRYGSDGVIEFLGRTDEQVKIRGHRIELGEIEQQLAALGGIDRAIVKRHQPADRGATLLAYVTLVDGARDATRERVVRTQAADGADGWDALRDAVEREARQPRLGVEMSRDELSDRIAEFDRQYQQALFDLFFRLDLLRHVGDRVSVDDVLRHGNVVERYRRWVGRALAHLADHGFLEPDGDGWRCRRALPARPVAPSLGYDLVAILTESTLSAELYLSESTIVGYQRIFASCHSLVCAAIESLVGAAGGRPLDILEVGAGHGSCTQHVLPLLPADATYRFTDISSYFLQAAREKFAAYPRVDYALFDLDRDPQFQGLARHSFDVIVAASVLHDIKDVRAAIDTLYALLKPGGTLVVIEETRFYPFFDLGMGLQQGFDGYTDTGLRQHHPLLSRQQWTQLLADGGFRTSTWTSPPRSAAELIGFEVLLARMPDAVAVLDEARVDACLRAQLPDYMIPSRYVCLRRMPLTANGKVDRKALPAPADGALGPRADFVAPQGSVEEALVRIWSQVIGQDVVGATDNFFKLGGDSLLAVQLATRIQAQFACALPVRAIFEAPTVRELACLVELSVGGDERADDHTDAADAAYARGTL